MWGNVGVTIQINTATGCVVVLLITETCIVVFFYNTVTATVSYSIIS